MYKPLLAALAFLAMGTTVDAKLRLPHILCNEMIIQHSTDVRLWGWATPGNTVTVTTSWSNAKQTATADKDGKWIVTVASPAASYDKLSVTFREKGTDASAPVTLTDILAGDVWVCAGQSNMEMTVKGFGNCPVEDYNKVVIDAKQRSGIHYVKIPDVMSSKPLDDANCQWKTVSPSTVGDASATGYFFARVINQATDIPVGLVMANKGGSRVESWLDEEYLRANTDEPVDSVEIVKKQPTSWTRTLLWGNGTFHPILNYTVKGILYYQGCSNVGAPEGQYTKRLADLAKQWRRDFRCGEIPFYIVEIAPYHYDNMDGDWGARLREQQYKASLVIPNCGFISTNDCVYPYEKEQIHPAQKQKVGERLAYCALNKTYGMKDVIGECLTFKEMKIINDTVCVHFNGEHGAISRFEDIQGFEVAGEDRVFHPATAKHFWRPGDDPWNECVTVTSPEVKNPVALRYCFKNFQLGNLANAGGLPLVPFRTDNW